MTDYSHYTGMLIPLSPFIGLQPPVGLLGLNLAASALGCFIWPYVEPWQYPVHFLGILIASYSMVRSQLIGVLFLFWAVLTAADPEAKLLNEGCSPVKSTNVTLFNNNLKAVLEALRAKIVSSGFATAEQVISTDPVYGLAQCRKDKTPSDCLKCITVAGKQIRNCSAVSGGRVIYDGCFLRYESNNFYSEATDAGNKQFCGATKASGDSNQFSETAQNLIIDLITVAPKTAGLFAAQLRNTSEGPSNSTIYALASCVRSINESGCSECLGIAEGNIKTCLRHTEGRAVDVGCYLRYATYPFFPSNATTDLTALLSSGSEISNAFSIFLLVC